MHDKVGVKLTALALNWYIAKRKEIRNSKSPPPQTQNVKLSLEPKST